MVTTSGQTRRALRERTASKESSHDQYVGLDVSLEETKIHVLDEAGGRVWRGKCASHPDELETTICKHAPGAVRIGLETGPLTTWLWTGN